MAKELKIVKWDGMNCFVELFDEQFSVSDFETSVEHAEIESESILDSARIAIKKAYEKQEPESKLVLDITDDIKQAIENGEARLDIGKNGEVYAQLRCANGRLGGKISVKEELQEEGITVEELKLSMQMEIIKEQLKSIIESVKQIEGKVTEVIQGQRNDRLGLFYSGLSLYIEARAVSDEYLKKQILSQALKSLSDAHHQIIQDMRMAMEYLMTERYKETKTNMRKNIDERLNIIHQCYEVIFRASFLKAAIYQENGEIPAMLIAINEYGRFVEKLIIPYAGRLSELDRNSHFIEKSIWGQMAASLSGCNELRKRLASDEVHYLSLGGMECE